MKIIHRMKILLAVAQELEIDLDAEHLQLYLFLYCTEFVENNHYYNFITRNSLPFSIQANADIEYLQKQKNIKIRYATELDFFEKIAIQKLKNEWKGKDIKDYILAKYQPIETQADAETIFYTIGYEGLSPDEYLSKLVKNKITLLCDVRKNAYSQKYGFSKNELINSLNIVGIGYKHIPELGIISEKRQELNSEKDYRNLFSEYEQNTLAYQEDNLELLTKLLQENKRIAITCFESDHKFCHRGCIAKALKNKPNFKYKIEHL